MRNPKDEAATTEGRARLDLLEPVADEAIARAMAFGADKYGTRNFYQSNIEARTYIAAMRRHISAWLDGEDNAPDSGVSHLAHVAASVHVVMAAQAAGTFVDDRHPPRTIELGKYDSLIEKYNPDFGRVETVAHHPV